jgi:hypothetical protein
METKTIVMCVVALLLGILISDMLQNVCGCKDIVEGQGQGQDLGTCRTYRACQTRGTEGRTECAANPHAVVFDEKTATSEAECRDLRDESIAIAIPGCIAGIEYPLLDTTQLGPAGVFGHIALPCTQWNQEVMTTPPTGPETGQILGPPQATSGACQGRYLLTFESGKPIIDLDEKITD